MPHQSPTHHSGISGHRDDVRFVHSVDAGSVGFVQWIKIIQTLGIPENKSATRLTLTLCQQWEKDRNTGWWYTYPSEKYESQLGVLFPI